MGEMEHAFCTKCGSGIYQTMRAHRDQFRVVFPTTFQIETGSNPVPSSRLPAQYMPKMHIHYENRLFDWHDELPKCKTGMQEKLLVQNDGELILDELLNSV